MELKRLEVLCQLGENADLQLRNGRVRDALKTYVEIATHIEKSGDVDSYLMAKLTLGVLRCHVKLGDFKNAFAIWNASLDDGLHGIGIYALESAQTTVQDMITYDMLCAFLHTLADSEKRDSAGAVNQYLSRVCEQAIEDADRATLRLALSNWKQHLREIFQSAIPHEFAVPMIRFEKSLGEAVKPQPIDFPLPRPWEKPTDFREMSRIVQIKATSAKNSKDSKDTSDSRSRRRKVS